MVLREPEYFDLPTSSGLMRTHLFSPAGEGKHPAIVLFSEIYQMTDPIRRTAAYLAGHGFLVAVPEVYHEFEEPGCVLAYDTVGTDRGNFLKTAKPVSAYDDDARAAISWLHSFDRGNGCVGAMGMCLGGHLAFRAAMNPGVQAGVCLYATDIHKRSLGLGMNDDTLDRMPELRAEMLMIWGRQDPHVPQEGRALIYQAMTSAGISFTWHEFNGQHAFIRDEGLRYDAELAGQVYRMAIDLFRRKLIA